ncbi:MAG: hypothetical protein QF394_06545 [Rhodospirillales bacterium]|nr:hypothetical protein [Rhodospirillales bacterium]
MERITLIVALIAGFALVQPSLAAGKGKELSDRAKAMDANKDGLVQAGEAQGMLKSNFKEMDCDKNGGLDGAEISGFFSGGCPEPAIAKKSKFPTGSEICLAKPSACANQLAFSKTLDQKGYRR